MERDKAVARTDALRFFLDDSPATGTSFVDSKRTPPFMDYMITIGI